MGGYSALPHLDDIPSIDMSDCQVIPGLVDTHLHGTGGFASMDADRKSDLSGIARTLAAHGVTSFVATVLAAPQEKMLAVIRALAKQAGPNPYGAELVGIHLEGPYISFERRGAQSAEAVRAIDVGEVQALLEAGNSHIKTMTFAPELPDSEALLEVLLAHGVTPSMGHSSADEAAVLRAINAGARRCTHLFNGMPPLNQREASLTSLGLTDDRLVIELTCDGVHVHPRMIDLACRSKPRPGVVGISDATQGAGLEDGIYHLGEDEVCIAEGFCRRVSDGKLAGSCLTLDQALRNLRDFTTLPRPDVVACYTANAAASIRLTDRGIIQPGKRADLTVVNDRWEVQMTIVNGRVVFDRRAAAP